VVTALVEEEEEEGEVEEVVEEVEEEEEEVEEGVKVSKEPPLKLNLVKL
jgi:hypothetical protein